MLSVLSAFVSDRVACLHVKYGALTDGARGTYQYPQRHAFLIRTVRYVKMFDSLSRTCPCSFVLTGATRDD